MKRQTSLPLALSIIVFGIVGPASAAPLHCHKGYVVRAKVIKRHQRGHVVKVKKSVCVKVKKTSAPESTLPPLPPQAYEPTPTPPTPAPTPTPTPAPLHALEITVATWDPISVELAEYNKAKTGDRYVAAELSITNVSGATISGDANLDTVIIGTNGQTYAAAFAVERKGCTDFGYGAFTLAPGAHEVGCIVYELPISVKIAEVQFDLGEDGEEIRTFG